MSSGMSGEERAFAPARDRYAELGVDVEAALERLATIPISLHCWQGDDIGGFENTGADLGGGLAVTGNYPGRARTPDELRADLDAALALIPGTHRLNLHASYAETGGPRLFGVSRWESAAAFQAALPTITSLAPDRRPEWSSAEDEVLTMELAVTPAATG